MKAVAVEVITDLTCPWHWINHRILIRTLRQMTGCIAATVEYGLVELNPGLPAEGMRRSDFRVLKFGSRARAELMDRIAWKAARRVDATLNFALIKNVPNTRLAHRLIDHVQRSGSAASTTALVEALFFGHFSKGLDIGSPRELEAIGLSVGLPERELRTFFESAGSFEAVQLPTRAQSIDPEVDALPRMRIADICLVGAQAPSVVRRTLRKVATAHSRTGDSTACDGGGVEIATVTNNAPNDTRPRGAATNTTRTRPTLGGVEASGGYRNREPAQGFVVDMPRVSMPTTRATTGDLK